MGIRRATSKAATALVAGALMACCVPSAAIAAEQVQDGGAAASTAMKEDTNSFDSLVGMSSQRWSDVPAIAEAWGRLHGSGGTPSSLASFHLLFQSVHAYGTQVLALYENGAPVLLEDGHHYRISADIIVSAKTALDAARSAARTNTATAYYDQSRAVITAVNAALCSAVPAPDADALKLLWDGRALEQVADEIDRSVALPKGSKATAKACSISIPSPLSQSGASATFAKSGGSSKISVSEDGRCALKKGTRKGTCSARVWVAYSSNTSKLVTVTFEVK